MIIMKNNNSRNPNVRLTYTENATLPFHSKNSESCYVSKYKSNSGQSNLSYVNPNPDDMLKEIQNKYFK